MNSRCWVLVFGIALAPSVDCGSTSTREQAPLAQAGDDDSPAAQQARCERGDLDGCTQLGIALAEGEGIEPDHRLATKLFHLACDGGVMLACANEGIQIYYGFGVEENNYLSRQYFYRACEGGLELGCYLTIQTAYRGSPSARRPEEVVRGPAHPEAFYTDNQSGCTAGDGSACHALGVAYQRGEGVRFDLARARSLFERGCELGSEYACHEMGVLYYRGYGVERDFGRAAELFALGCRGDLPGSCNSLAGIYSAGDHAPNSSHIAVDLYYRACGGGYGLGCFNVAVAYLEGEAVPSDEGLAEAFMRRACADRDYDACFWTAALRMRAGDANAAASFSRLACEGGQLQGCDAYRSLAEGIAGEIPLPALEDYGWAPGEIERTISEEPCPSGTTPSVRTTRWFSSDHRLMQQLEEFDDDCDGTVDGEARYYIDPYGNHYMTLAHNFERDARMRIYFFRDLDNRVFFRDFYWDADEVLDSRVTNIYDDAGLMTGRLIDGDLDGTADNVCTIDPPCPPPYADCRCE